MGMWIGRLVDWAQEVSQGALQFTGNFDTHQNEGLSWKPAELSVTHPMTTVRYIQHDTSSERKPTPTRNGHESVTTWWALLTQRLLDTSRPSCSSELRRPSSQASGKLRRIDAFPVFFKGPKSLGVVEKIVCRMPHNFDKAIRRTPGKFWNHPVIW